MYKYFHVKPKLSVDSAGKYSYIPIYIATAQSSV